MKTKTISGHYDTVLSIAHNNRDFVPRNVDPNRICNNYNCVAAGHEVQFDLNNPVYLQDFWDRYKALSDLYWSQRVIARTLEWERYQEHLRVMRRLSSPYYPIPGSVIEALVTLFLLPLLVPCGIYLSHEQRQFKTEWEDFQNDQWLRDMEFQASKRSLRDALRSCDKLHGSHYLKIMDSVVGEMSQIAGIAVVDEPKEIRRYATVEEIYGKVFQPSFEQFQAKQRPSRRYSGTYLEQIREKRKRAERKGGQRKGTLPAEAYEIVFTIGDMDNTGYQRAPLDASQAETLLKDFCDHLRDEPHICVVTTREMKDPDWKPSFRSGLIAVNLVTHCDEATPGVHFTFIPYIRGCKRGPDAQATLGQALAGMGYPSKWVEVLDESGQRIPKLDRNGQVIREKDGSVRYKKEPQGQGLIDWIEDQKQWIQSEMLRRYGWEREYKGSHPRGNLSTPDYKAARAKERLQELEARMKKLAQDYGDHIGELTAQLTQTIGVVADHSNNRDLIDRYLDTCPDEEYYVIVGEAMAYLSNLPEQEQIHAVQNLEALIAKAQGADQSQPQTEKKFQEHTH